MCVFSSKSFFIFCVCVCHFFVCVFYVCCVCESEDEGGKDFVCGQYTIYCKIRIGFIISSGFRSLWRGSIYIKKHKEGEYIYLEA